MHFDIASRKSSNIGERSGSLVYNAYNCAHFTPATGIAGYTRLNVVINRVARGIAVAGIKFRREQRVPAATGWNEEDEGAVAAGKKRTENRVPGTRNGNGIL